MAVPTSLARHRRTFLRGSVGAIALFAGCLADPDDGSDPGAGTDDSADSDGSGGSDENESSGGDTDSETDATDSADNDTDESTGDAVTYETTRYHYPDSSTEPDAMLLADQDDATDWLADRTLEDDEVGAFVDETPFADATLIALEAAAPNACYEMGLEAIGVPDGTAAGEEGTTDGGESDDSHQLELEATVRDESDETEACAQALTTVGVLVRAAVDAEPVTDVSAVIVDERGDEHEIGAAVDTD